MEQIKKDPLVGWAVWRVSNNKNAIIVINGATGSGKSWAGLRLGTDLAAGLGTTFTIANNVDFSFEGLLKKMDLPDNDKPGTVFLFEEVGSVGGGASFREWQSKSNAFFNSFLQTSRHLRQILIMTTPQFTYLDASSRKLVHLQMNTHRIDYENKLCLLRPYILQVNNRDGKIYFKYLRYTNNNIKYKLQEYWCSLPPQELVDKYEIEKKKYTDHLRKTILGSYNVGKERKKQRIINPKYSVALLEKGFTILETAEALNISIPSVARHKKAANG